MAETSKSLIELRKKANKLNVDFKLETTEEELSALVSAAETKAAEDKEAAIRLAKLRKEAAKLGVQYIEEMTGDEVADLIEKAKAEGASDDATAFEVYTKDGGYVRTYTEEIHGKVAKAKAYEYAGKIGGSVKKA